MVNISNIIASSFYSIHNDIKNNKFTHYFIKGGRGSTKSSFISIEIILGMIKDKNANCVALRKVGFNLKDSVYEQFKWAITILNLDNYWQFKISPLEIKYIPTGQKIIFRGADNPKKIKSTKFSNGYCKFIWYEELDEFNGMEEIRVINQSLMRGGSLFFVFYSYNPPKSNRNWVNEEINNINNTRLVHHSTYLDVPKSWLGEQFFIEAEYLKNTKPDICRHEYLGDVIGTGGEIFKNITVRNITDEEIKCFDRISRGLDWGYAVDPLHYTVNHYDKTRRKIYIFYEVHKVGMSNRVIADIIKKENKSNNLVICDSAEPKSIAEMNSYGLRVIGAKKGADSVEYGIKWLQDLEEIIIDPIRCPNTLREFNSYEMEIDKKGNFKSNFPDKDNHSIDAVRYSREMDMRNIKVR